MKIGDVARRAALSAHTLRYYERIGLLPYADRDRSGQRYYDASILTWIAFLGRLRTTGMPIREMLHYAALRAEDPATGPARRRLLEAHRAQVREHVAALQASLLVLDTKIAGYADADTDRDDHEPSSPEPERQVRARPARAVAD